MRPQRSSSQLASADTLNMLKVVLRPAAALVGEELALVRWRVAIGELLTWGRRSARAALTRARACSNPARATAICWFAEAARTSSRFNSASPNISHHAPRGRCAAGSAAFHVPLLLRAASPNAAGRALEPSAAGR